MFGTKVFSVLFHCFGLSSQVPSRNASIRPVWGKNRPFPKSAEDGRKSASDVTPKQRDDMGPHDPPRIYGPWPGYGPDGTGGRTISRNTGPRVPRVNNNGKDADVPKTPQMFCTCGTRDADPWPLAADGNHQARESPNRGPSAAYTNSKGPAHGLTTL